MITMFKAGSPDWKENKYNGPVIVVREIADAEETRMYECLTIAGESFHAFEDELTPAPDIAQ